MRRVFRWALLLALLSPLLSAQIKNGAIKGRVTDSAGHPQLGVMIEVLTSAKSPIRVYTDVKGQYSAQNLLPGMYFVKASASSFLPTMRESINLKAGAVMVVNLTMNTLMEAVQLLPSRKSMNTDDTDWRWTLRAAANRPILRVLEDSGPLVVVQNSDNAADRVLKASVTFITGQDSGQSGSALPNTAFNLEQPLFSSGTSTLSLAGNLGMVDGQPNGVF